ncbi:activating transcription factor 7-interacting protein 2-like isoform X2 [Trematomus bernacchii]|uniref:activating transcription factor 7-interacting protein 2-like isoform X2 n=1 Tax=Trematomus bernacchii TaxID=40690 RepID=UPI00146ADB23|nr:activating transcription factor 7-interacting protein 2-like isoform X2 [Trematomus bernacchii]
MADARDRTPRTRSRADQKTFKPSPKRKSPRLSSSKQTKLAGDARVNIGSAFETWSEVKASKGLKSDAELALTLLNQMKRLPTNSDSSGPSKKKIKLSQSEVQTLIEQEVQTALTKKENKLLGLIGTIQEQDESLDYKSSIQKLEERMNTVTRRAEAAIAFMTKTHKENPQPSLDNVKIKREDSAKDKKIPPGFKSDIESMEKRVEFLNMMKSTKTGLTKMQEDNESLKAVIAKQKLPPPVPTPNGSSDCKESLIKKEPDVEESKQSVEDSKQSVEESKQSVEDSKQSVEESKQFVEDSKQSVEDSKQSVEESKQSVEDSKQSVKLKAVMVKEENLSSDHSRPNTEQDELYSYPPLPSTNFPSILSIEVASYNLPGRPKVNVALIKNPVGLSVLWSVEDKDPSAAPPMDSYGLFMTMEKVKGSGVFPSWTALGEVEAVPLPMCVMISKYKPGHTVCVAVIGKDKFGRTNWEETAMGWASYDHFKTQNHNHIDAHIGHTHWPN